MALVDAGRPSNLASEGIGGLLGHDGRPPADFYRRTDRELAAYPTVHRHADEVTGVAAVSSAWSVTLAGGSVAAVHVVLAMGMDYAYPAIDGIESLWGASVFHCPFCHGWEHCDQPLGVLAGGPMTVERAQLLANWSDRVSVIAGPGELSDEERGQLQMSAIDVVDGQVARLRGSGRQLTAIELADGRDVQVTGLLVAAPHGQRPPFLVDALGLQLDASGHVVVDELGRTSRPGIWAAGDLTSPMSMVARVVGAGALVAVWIVQQLTADRHGRPFQPPGDPGTPGTPGDPGDPGEAAEPAR